MTIAVDWKGVSAVVLFDAGVCLDADGSTVCVPYRRPDGSTFRVKRFPAAGGSHWGHGSGVVPFGLDELAAADAASSSVIVCEGESDALAVRSELVERDGRRVVAVGVPGASAWRSTWTRWLDGFPIVYLAGDGDEAGRRMIDRMLRDLPRARPLLMPTGEDCRSVVQRDPEELCGLLDDADLRAELVRAFRAAATLAECRRMLARGPLQNGEISEESEKRYVALI